MTDACAGPIKRNREGETITWHLRSPISMELETHVERERERERKRERGYRPACTRLSRDTEAAFALTFALARAHVRLATDRNEKF